SFVAQLLDIKSLPIIILADESINQTAKTIQAMTIGAVDFIKINQKNQQAWSQKEKEIIHKFKSAVKVKPLRSQKQLNKSFHHLHTRNVGKNRKNIRRKEAYKQTIIAIGSSTGGPRALQEILRALPNSLQTPILIVQHMPKGFTKSLATRLNTICHLNVQEAEHGDIIENGTVYIAPGDFHMKVL